MAVTNTSGLLSTRGSISFLYTDYDFGYYIIEESGCYDTSELGNLSNYIDYEAFGRDVRLETEGGFTSLGWLERC